MQLTMIPLAFFAVLTLVSTLSRADIDTSLLKGMEARAIGPAATSGRITDLEAVISDPSTIYAGTATGGLWKSVNAGLSWNPLFDKEDFASIGAIAINQKTPSIIWVGTGEGNTRNSTSYGGGMYRSLDSGKSWKNIGLEGSERINRIALHPSNPDIAYVAALGTLWSENKERGIYKTEDGGESWTRILYVDEKTGATDIKMDPTNPDKLYAAMWEFRRWPDYFESGGKGSGLYVSTDGGDSWDRQEEEDGMPKGDLGRMVIAVSQSNPNIVYTLVEAKESALIRSEDGGHSWKTVNSEVGIADRPFYYSQLEVDPNDPETIYNIATRIRRSIDGGKNFSRLAAIDCCAVGNTIHVDNHALWINPENSKHILLGNDGGIAITHDTGDSWRYVQNLPVSQFYHVRVDNDHPYHIYGGLQDNGTWRGPGEVWNTGGIRNVHWQEIGFGDGFDAMPYPDNSRAGYAMSQGGNLFSWNLDTYERRPLRPNGPDDGTELRFNWNSALEQDPFDDNTIYYGSQFVHKSKDRGTTWEIISGDLTTNNKGWQRFKKTGGITADVTAAENFTSIVTIAVSPLEQGVIWVGTDDGRIHITRDAGKHWTSIESNAKGVPKHTWVPHIEPSRYDAGAAYIVFDNHRRGDMRTYVYKASNYGSRMKNVGADNLRGYALSIQQDHKDENLLFLGTELGLHVSTNAGKQWFKWDQGVPTVSVMDMDIQERENDLVLGTHGRSIFVIDDYSALRSLSEADFSASLKLLSVTDGQQYQSMRAPSTRFWGSGAFEGENEAYGVVLTLIAAGDFLKHPDAAKEIARGKARRLKDAAESEAKAISKAKATGGSKPKTENEADSDMQDEPDDKARVEISDADGKLIRTFVTQVQQGVNRVTWNMSSDGVRQMPEKMPEEDKDILPSSGIEVPPGSYSIKFILNDQELIATANVIADPRYNLSSAEHDESYAQNMHIVEMRRTMANLIHALHNAKTDIELIQHRADKALLSVTDKDAEDAHPLAQLKKSGKAVLKKLKDAADEIRTDPKAVGRVDSSFTLNHDLSRAHSYFKGTYGKASPTALIYLKKAEDHLESSVATVNELLATDVTEFRAQFQNTDLSLLGTLETISNQ
jgi:photosystem II stability/assembly factor-like uncharacterized protein